MSSSDGKLTFLFIRHGETQDNIDRKLQGWRDTSLTDKGHREAGVLASKLASTPIDVVYHSPLLRMQQTIAPILKDRKDVEVISDADLRGQGLGVLEGGSYDDIDMSNPRSSDGTEGGELFDQFVQRIVKCFGRSLAKEAPKTSERGRTVAIAAHGVVITSIFKALEGSEKGWDNGGVAKRGPDAYEVRWTDSDDVARMVVDAKDVKTKERGKEVDWNAMDKGVMLIEYWGKKEKAL